MLLFDGYLQTTCHCATRNICKCGYFFSIMAHGGNEATCRTILTISIKKSKYVDRKHEFEVFCYRTIIACPVKPISYIYMRKFDLQCLELLYVQNWPFILPCCFQPNTIYLYSWFFKRVLVFSLVAIINFCLEVLGNYRSQGLHLCTWKLTIRANE
jgi:hypothetical protein